MRLNTATTSQSQLVALSSSQHLAWQALAEHRFFKLIAGGSLTELSKLAFLTKIYSEAGVDCIDIAPVPEVVEVVDSVLNQLPLVHAQKIPPMVMVSIPLDPDPHFRKIELIESDCIACGVCLPICPTEAFSFSDSQTLTVHQPLCYGCGRCVPICPTEALLLHPFWQADTFSQVLSHPRVEAIELHTQHADPLMLLEFLGSYGHLLKDKLIAYCFRPETAKTEFWLESLLQLVAFAPNRVLLQIDGAPMSGNDSPEASKPAIESAKNIYKALQQIPDFTGIPITVSGGINNHTAQLLVAPENHFIAGVGMGTVARKAIWLMEENQAEAESTARGLVANFRTRISPLVETKSS